ncbi:MAG TPA: glycosyltransferase [Beijerinckiaceae bacterium]|jgi:hypothetical protein
MPTAELPVLDVSFVVNIHGGRNFLARTMRSLEASAMAARAAGLGIELLFALDRSPAETVAWAQAYRPENFDRFRIERFDNGSLGLSRQQGLEAARSEYIQFCDEDDLISSNTTLAMHETARAAGPRTIVVPEYLFGFGALDVLAHYAGTDLISPLSFIAQHPFVSRIFVHRSIAEHVRYGDVPLAGGYAYEDWHFNATAVAAGFAFRPAPSTVLFYRHRPQGMLAGMNAASTRQIPPTPLFEPATYIRTCRESYYRRRLGQIPQVDPAELRSRFLDDPAIKELVLEANRIDPAVDPARIEAAPVMSNLVGDFALGEAYFQACRLVGNERFTDVVVATEIGPASPQRHCLDVCSALAGTRAGIRTLVLLHRPDASDDLPRERPPGTVLIDLASLWPGLNADQVDTIALRLMEATAPAARLHLTANPFARRFFGKYKAVLTGLRAIFYRTDDPVRPFAGGRVRQGEAFDFLSEHLESFSLVVADNDALIGSDRQRLDRSPEKWCRLYRTGGALPAPVAATHRVLAIEPSREAHGLDFARVGRHASAGLRPIRIDTAAGWVSLESLAAYDALLISEADALDYSFYWQVLAAGVAIVAPASAPALEAVGETGAGILFEPDLNDADTEAALADALREIYATDETALTYRLRAHEQFTRRHLWPSFEKQVGELFA